jgi:hypothetical protein
LVKVKGEPPGFGGVHVCGGAVTAGGCEQPAEPPTPAKMKLTSRSGNPGVTLNAMNGVLANVDPTGFVAIFRLSMVFCPFSVANEPAPAVRVNMSAAFGIKSLCHDIMVDVTVTMPLKLKVPEIGAAGRLTAVSPAKRHRDSGSARTVIQNPPLGQVPSYRLGSYRTQPIIY